MGAMRMLAAAQLRRRWLSVAALTLLVGFVGVVVLASVAGARRTASSLARFEDESRAADVEVNAGFATAEQMREFAHTPNVAAVGELRVVGIVRRPLDLGGRGAAGGVLVLTRAFVDQYRDRIGSYAGSVLRVRTEHGAADVPPVVAAARRIFGHNDSFQTLSLAVEGEGAQSAIDVTTVALWLVAAVAGIAGAVAITIALSRYMSTAIVDQDVLRALGVRPRERWAATFATALPIAVAGPVLAGAAAWAASPMFPIGVARRAEPDPGLHADVLVLVAGVAAAIAIVLAIAATTALIAIARRERAFSRP